MQHQEGSPADMELTWRVSVATYDTGLGCINGTDRNAASCLRAGDLYGDELGRRNESRQTLYRS